MQKKKGNRVAIIAQSLYLANLLLLPGLSFIALIVYFYREKLSLAIARIHLYRSLQLSVLAGFLIIVVPALVIILSPQFDASLMVMLLYFVTIHAALVLVGMLNLARAMSGRPPIF